MSKSKRVTFLQCQLESAYENAGRGSKFVIVSQLGITKFMRTKVSDGFIGLNSPKLLRQHNIGVQMTLRL